MDEYLKTLPTITGLRGLVVWQAALSVNNRIPEPAAYIVEDAYLFFSWDDKFRHLEAEIPDVGPVSWFYCCRETGFHWLFHWTPGEAISPDLSLAFSLFIPEPQDFA